MHHRPRAAASPSAIHDTHPGDGLPVISPRRVPAEEADFTGALSGPPGACGAPAVEHPHWAINGRHGNPAPPGSMPNPPTVSEERSPHRPDRDQTVRSWPLLVLALPATVAVWSGWVGIGQMTGFGQVYPLPGIFNSLHLDTAVTLPVGVEAYAAYALRAWLSASAVVSARTRQFARWSAIGSLILGMAGQVAYHLLAQAGATHAPWGITTAVSCLPVLVLGMGAALAHLLRADEHSQPQPTRTKADLADRSGTRADHAAAAIRPDRMIEAEAAAALLSTAGKRVSRRTLRTAGIHGSNADLGTLARIVKSQPTSGKAPATSPS
jgi:hypothetical protein